MRGNTGRNGPCPTCPTCPTVFAEGRPEMRRFAAFAEAYRLPGAPEPPPPKPIQPLPEPPMDHDAAEVEAMAEHYAAPCGRHDPSSEKEDFSQIDPWIRGLAAPSGSDLPQSDPMLRGLLAAALKRPPAWPDPLAVPPRGSRCSTCGGQHFWADPRGWRCSTCGLVPVGIPTKEVRT